MKKSIFSLLMAVAIAASADEPTSMPSMAAEFSSLPAVLVQEAAMPTLPKEEPLSKQGFVYVRFAAAEGDLFQTGRVLPGLGLGYRRLAGDGAADISLSGIGHAERKGGRIFWTAPKATYIHYLEPQAQKSPYVGGGLAWGGMNTRGQEFVGLIPSVVAGFEFTRKSTILSFAELTVSQPALSVYRKGIFPGPCAEFSTGIGF